MANTRRRVEITPEVRTLRKMRLAKRISLVQAGRLVGVHGSAIVHLEQGRMALPAGRLEEIVRAYGYSMDDLQSFLSGKEIPTNYLRECQAILPRLSKDQLRLVYEMVRHFGVGSSNRSNKS